MNGKEKNKFYVQTENDIHCQAWQKHASMNIVIIMKKVYTVKALIETGGKTGITVPVVYVHCFQLCFIVYCIYIFEFNLYSQCKKSFIHPMIVVTSFNEYDKSCVFNSLNNMVTYH